MGLHSYRKDPSCAMPQLHVLDDYYMHFFRLTPVVSGAGVVRIFVVRDRLVAACRIACRVCFRAVGEGEGWRELGDVWMLVGILVELTLLLVEGILTQLHLEVGLNKIK